MCRAGAAFFYLGESTKVVKGSDGTREDGQQLRGQARKIAEEH